MPRLGGPFAAREQAEPVTEPGRDVGGGQRPEPGGGEFDRQRQAVEGGADPRHGVAVGGFAGSDGRGPLGEQPRGGDGGQGADRDQRLAGQAQRFAAGGQHAHAGSGPEQPPDQPRGIGDDVFAVVEDEQQRPVGEPGGQAVGGIRGRTRRQDTLFTQPQRDEDSGCDLGRRGQFDEADIAGFAGRGFDGEPRLARPAGPGERDEACRTERRAEPVELAAADEPGERHRNPARGRPAQDGRVRVGELG